MHFIVRYFDLRQSLNKQVVDQIICGEKKVN